MGSKSRLRLLIAAVAVLIALAPGHSQESFTSWTSLPENRSGLVIIVDRDVSFVALEDTEGRKLDTAKWNFGTPFIRQYRVPPGIYRLQLSALIKSVDIAAEPAALTYIRLAPYKVDQEDVGLQITSWTGPPTSEIRALIKRAQDEGIADVLGTARINPASNELYLNTDPPWLPPPPPER